VAEIKELQQKVDHTALIVQMTAAVNEAAHRWDEVGRIYAESWDAGFGKHVEILGKIKAQKEARDKAGLEKAMLCFQLATVFLPVIGGPAAIAMAPILTARARLFTSTMEKKARDLWTGYARQEPIASKVVAEVGKRSIDAGKSAAEKIQKSIVEKLIPKYPELEAKPAVTPVKAFKDKNSATRDFMNGWVKECSGWNVAGGIDRLLIPVAHQLFLNHPWIKTAPAVEATLALQTSLTSYIEMAAWMRWARTLDEKHWKNVHTWYYTDYSTKNRNDRVQMVQNRSRRMALETLDYRSLYLHFAYNFPRGEYIRKLTILDPSTGFPGDDVTLDLYEFIQMAKSKEAAARMLKKLVPAGQMNEEIAGELMAA